MSVLDQLRSNPYAGYAYGYPHKMAYGSLEPGVTLDRLWEHEPKHDLTLYVHVPICEMRCGFCNLFTLRADPEDFEPAYLAALERQTERVLSSVGEATFTHAAIGGGTPTQLSVGGLQRVLALLERARAAPADVPLSVETSPRTADAERLDLLSQAGVQRLSIGVQSFDEKVTHALGRPQQRSWVIAALERIRARAFPVLNVDLIYGAEGQTRDSFSADIDAALEYRPEELYLYPLYVRPRTGLGTKLGPVRRLDTRLELYRAGRARLLEAGYEQVSMRFFRRPDAAAGADTCCQEDGTVGLGCGARSYTRGVHYAHEWAPDQPSIREILERYVVTPTERFALAPYGIQLSLEEQRRRYVIKTLLRATGLPLAGYHTFFGSSAAADFPELEALARSGLARIDADTVRLTESGLELSDAIGPYFYSATVRERLLCGESAAC